MAFVKSKIIFMLVLFLPFIVYQSLLLFIVALSLYLIWLALHPGVSSNLNKDGKPSTYISVFGAYYFFSGLILLSLFLSKSLFFSDEDVLNWLMAVGWDHVTHAPLYWFAAQNFVAMDHNSSAQNLEVFHYAMGGYPQAWHFVTGVISRLFVEPYSLESLHFYMISVQITIVISIYILSISILRIFNSVLDLLTLPNFVTFKTNKFITFIFFIFLFLSQIVLYGFMGIWSAPGWVNWPLAISLFFWGASKLVHTIDIDNLRKQSLVQSFLLLILVMLYQSIFVIYAFIMIFIFIYLLKKNNKLSIVNIMWYSSSNLYALIMAITTFFYLQSQTSGSVDFLTDGGGTRIRLRYYLVLLACLILILLYQRFALRIVSELYLAFSLLFTVFLFTLISIVQITDFQPYFFAKLGTVFIGFGSVLVLCFLFAIISFTLFNNLSQKPSKTKESTNLRVLALFLGAILPISYYAIANYNLFDNPKFKESTFQYNLLATIEPSQILTYSSYLGNDILNVESIGFTNRELKPTSVYFVGGNPFLANMWLSILRPNDASRAWLYEASWYGDTPGRWTNYINLFGSPISQEVIKNGLILDEYLVLYSKIENCESFKNKLPPDAISRFICLGSS
jgi:hypothetical protein